MSMDGKNPIVLLHGVFTDKVLSLLKEREPEKVFILEGRPALSGLLKTYPSLKKNGLNCFVIADNMPGFLFNLNFVHEVWIAGMNSPGKRVNTPVGSLILAVLAKHHQKPVYVFVNKNVKVSKKIDLNKNALKFLGKDIAPKGIKSFVPLIDELPKNLITEIYE